MVVIQHKVLNCLQVDKASVCITEVGVHLRYHMITRNDCVNGGPKVDHA